MKKFKRIMALCLALILCLPLLQVESDAAGVSYSHGWCFENSNKKQPEGAKVNGEDSFSYEYGVNGKFSPMTKFNKDWNSWTLNGQAPAIGQWYASGSEAGDGTIAWTAPRNMNVELSSEVKIVLDATNAKLCDGVGLMVVQQNSYGFAPLWPAKGVFKWYDVKNDGETNLKDIKTKVRKGDRILFVVHTLGKDSIGDTIEVAPKVEETTSNPKYPVGFYDWISDGKVQESTGSNMKTEGQRYYPIYPNPGDWEWKTINGSEDSPTIANDTRISQLPMQAGDNLLIIVRPKDCTESTISILPNVQVEATYKVANFPFPDNTAFSDWNTTNYGTVQKSTIIHTSGTTAKVTTAIENDIGWYVQQEENPYGVGTWNEAAYTFTYFDFGTSGFETMETHVTADWANMEIEDSGEYETVWVDAYWKAQDEEDVAIQGHQLKSTSGKYAAIAYKAPADGAVILLEDMEFVAREGDGELLLLQRRGEKYSVLRGWTRVQKMKNTKLDPYRGYVRTGDIVYLVWRPLKSAGVEKSTLWMNTNNYDTAGLIHCVNSAVDNTEPTVWTTLGRTVDADLCKTYFTGRNLKLDEGLIGFNFWAVNTENMHKDAHVRFDVINDENDQQMHIVSGQDKQVYDDLYAKGNAAGKTLVCKLPAKEMSDKVIAYLCNGNNNVVDYVETTIKDYGEALVTLANSDNVEYQEAYGPYENFIYSMLNYGAYAQKYFSYNTELLANAKYPEKDDISAVEASIFTDKTNSEYNAIFGSGASKPANAEGVKFPGQPAKIQLSLKSDTIVRIAFSLDEQRVEEQLSVELLNADGTANQEATKEVSLYWDSDILRWVVQVKGIAAADLDTQYRVRLTDSVTNTQLTVRFTALSFTRSVMNTSSERGHNLAKALYRYNQEANIVSARNHDASQ